jgi:hypothetical protein
MNILNQKHRRRLANLAVGLDAHSELFQGSRAAAIFAAAKVRELISAMDEIANRWPDVSGKWHAPTCLGSNGPRNCQGCGDETRKAGAP